MSKITYLAYIELINVINITTNSKNVNRIVFKNDLNNSFNASLIMLNTFALYIGSIVSDSNNVGYINTYDIA